MRTIWGLGIVAVAILFGVLVIPRIYGFYLTFYGQEAFKELFYGHFGWSDAWASFASLAASLVTALAWAPLSYFSYRAFVLRPNARDVVATFSLAMMVYGLPFFLKGTTQTFGPIVGPIQCFDQRTGNPIRWYTIQNGNVVLFDSPDGVDAFGTRKKPIDRQTCIAINSREVPRRLTGTSLCQLEIFNAITGQPKVWYLRDGSRLELFSATGFHPTSGRTLVAVTQDMADEIRSHAEVECERARAREVETKRSTEQATREREVREREVREREVREQQAREREVREREASERQAREREVREREAREREAREREVRERTAREREVRERAAR
jgi:hypothetical protein